MRAYRVTFPFFAALMLGACASPSPELGVVREVGTGEPVGFAELPYPSNAYASGQIVELQAVPRKVEIAFDPKIPADMVTVSDGWRISSEEAESMRVKLAQEIARTLRGTPGYGAGSRVSVDFSDTRTRIVPKNQIFAAISKHVQKDPALHRLLRGYRANGTRFDVVTETLSATISLSVADASGAPVEIGPAMLEKLQSELSLRFEKNGNGQKTVRGSNVVVGIQYDPKMVGVILN